MHLQELGIATLTACFVNSNRDPKKGQPAKPADFFYFTPTEENNIPPAVANAFFSLAKDRLLPNWAAALAPVEKLTAVRNHHHPPKFRALIGDDLVIVCPTEQEGKILGAIAFTNETLNEQCQVTNPDTGESFTLYTKGMPSNAWILEVEIPHGTERIPQSDRATAN